MHYSINTPGAIGSELAAEVDRVWAACAQTAGIDLSGFDPTASLATRLAWAVKSNLHVAMILARYSSKMQHSTQSQVEECVRYAARNRMYAPPEYICIDEAVSGKSERRVGLLRAKEILKEKLAKVFLVFKVSRIFRAAYKGFELFKVNVVEEGLRGISVTQGIDTNDAKVWKMQMVLHGLMDDMLLEAIADHVRAGLANLFAQGYVTGALPVGYQAVDVPNARPTNLGKPRKMPQPDPAAVPLIISAFESVRDKMPIRKAWQAWVGAGGPKDPRSKNSYMTLNSFRKMLSNPRYRGVWAFGERRNTWSSKRDSSVQVPGKPDEIRVLQCEELRIVSDELFFAVQTRLAENKVGPQTHRTSRPKQLWDLVTPIFRCAECDQRMYQTGHNGLGMQCKHRDACPHQSSIRREEAVRKICTTLVELLHKDRELVTEILTRARETDAEGDGDIELKQGALERKHTTLTRRITELLPMIGVGSDADCVEMKNTLLTTQLERAAVNQELSRIRESLATRRDPITKEEAHRELDNLAQLLVDAGAGCLGDDLVYRARAVFETLCGGRIWIHAESRPGRKVRNIRATFTPNIVRTTQDGLSDPRELEPTDTAEVSVWLRIPKLELLAPLTHDLMDEKGLSLRAATKALQALGHDVCDGVVWQAHDRHHQIHGTTKPPKKYNAGRPRKSRLSDDAT